MDLSYEIWSSTFWTYTLKGKSSTLMWLRLFPVVYIKKVENDDRISECRTDRIGHASLGQKQEAGLNNRPVDGEYTSAEMLSLENYIPTLEEAPGEEL